MRQIHLPRFRLILVLFLYSLSRALYLVYEGDMSKLFFENVIMIMHYGVEKGFCMTFAFLALNADYLTVEADFVVLSRALYLVYEGDMSKLFFENVIMIVTLWRRGGVVADICIFSTEQTI